MRLLTGVASLLALAACDAVRVPGDGRAPPSAPPDIPEGAPGPPPPSVPVTDPYGEGIGEDADTDEDATGDAGTPEPETPDPDRGADPGTDAQTPGTGTESESDTPAPDPGTDTETHPEPETEPEPLPIKFTYYPPGRLTPGSGTGRVDETVYVPDMTFPIGEDPAFPGSQVWGYGGGMSTGGQCDPRNYDDAAWRDNFCEYRSKARNTPMCPSNNAHQGQDIRVGTRDGCLQMVDGRPAKPTLYPVVATEDGIIQYIGSYSLTLKGTETGNLYNYLHLNMGALQVSSDETVEAGQRIGYVSDDFGGTPTTYHLHFEIKAPLEETGFTHIPPYTSLIKAYERREDGRGERIEDDTVGVASVVQIPDGMEIVE